MNYKNEIIQVLDLISESDSTFLRRILAILLRHVKMKGGDHNE